MTIQDAITKAIEGGYSLNPSKILKIYPDKDVYLKFWVVFVGFEHFSPMLVDVRYALLQPEFWQALGKSMGWKPEGIRGSGRQGIKDGRYHKAEWLERQHRLIDHLAEGKDIESYFESL